MWNKSSCSLGPAANKSFKMTSCYEFILLVMAVVTWVGAIVPPDQQPGGSTDPFTVSDVVAPGDIVNPPGTEDDDAVVPTATFGIFTGK